MARIVRAFPLLPNKREALAAFIAELTSRRIETQQFYRAYGVTRESAHLQSTPHGDLLIVCTDLADGVEAAAKAYAAETENFVPLGPSQLIASHEPRRATEGAISGTTGAALACPCST